MAKPPATFAGDRVRLFVALAAVLAGGAVGFASLVASCAFSLAPLVSVGAEGGQDVPAGDAGDVGDAGGCADDLDSSPSSCGRCGHDCAGGACLAGICQPYVMSVEPLSYGLAADETYLYYTINVNPTLGGMDGGAIRRLDKASRDGGAITLVTTPDNSPRLLIIDDAGPANLYWTSDKGVYTARADGSTASRVACPDDHPWGSFELARDSDGTLYYTVGGGLVDGAIRRCNPATGVVDTVAATSTPKALFVDGQQVWWTSFCDSAHYNLDGTGNCDPDGGVGAVYFADKASTDLAQGTLRATIGAGGEAILPAGNDLYATSFNEGALYFLTKSAAVGAQVSRVLDNPMYVGADRIAFAPDDATLLYLSSYDGYLLAYDVMTLGVTALPVGDSPHVLRFVADDTFLYWTTFDGNSVVRLRR